MGICKGRFDSSVHSRQSIDALTERATLSRSKRAIIRHLLYERKTSGDLTKLTFSCCLPFTVIIWMYTKILSFKRLWDTSVPSCVQLLPSPTKKNERKGPCSQQRCRNFCGVPRCAMHPDCLKVNTELCLSVRLLVFSPMSSIRSHAIM